MRIFCTPNLQIYNIDARVMDVEVEPGRTERVCIAM